MPVSCTCRCTRPAASSTGQRKLTLPPTRLYLMALLSRLTSTWRRRSGSARTLMPTGAAGSACTLTPAEAAAGATMVSASLTTPCTGTVAGDKATPPLSMRERSSTSLIIASRWAPACEMCCTRACCEGLSGCAVSSASSCEKPSTALSGVRSSWLMRERNSVLAALARSAASAASSASSTRLRALVSMIKPRNSERPSSALTTATRLLMCSTRPSLAMKRYSIGREARAE